MTSCTRSRWLSWLCAVWVAHGVACAPRGVPDDAALRDSADDHALEDGREDEARDVAAHDAPNADTAMNDGSASMGDDASARDAIIADAIDEVGDGAVMGPPFVPPDFSLPDLNPNSVTYRMDVSPRAMRGRITAWYFGTST